MERQDLVKLSYAYGVSTALQEAGMNKKAADQEALAFVEEQVKQAENGDDETGDGGMSVLEGLGRGAAGGAGLGIGKIASAAMDGTARQPEATDAIRTTMIIAAAMIEGVAFFGIVTCILLSFK